MLEFTKKIWRDPVWSKVIATGIIATLAISFRHILTSCIPFCALLVALIIIVLLVPYWWRAIRKKKPQLHLAWHGSAGWGIGGLLQKDGGMERVLRVQGPVLISSSHLEEPIIVTGIELKDAEYAGPYFQMFEVKPGETIGRSLLLKFPRCQAGEGRSVQG